MGRITQVAYAQVENEAGVITVRGAYLAKCRELADYDNLASRVENIETKKETGLPRGLSVEIQKDFGYRWCWFHWLASGR